MLKAHDRNRFSPAFMYNMMHVPFDHGAYYSDAFEMLHELGVCSWATMPYNDGDYLTWPDESAFIEAMRSRTTEDRNTYNWMRLNGTADLVAAKELIVSGYAPIISIMVYDPYREIDSVNDEYTITEGRVGTDPGGHAQCIVGYDDNHVTADGTGAFLVVNSWGANWGNGGYYWLSYHAAMYHDTDSSGSVNSDDEAITKGVLYWSDIRTNTVADWQAWIKLAGDTSRAIDLVCSRGEREVPFLDLYVKNSDKDYQSFPDSYIVLDISPLFEEETKDADPVVFTFTDGLFDGLYCNVVDIQVYGPDGGSRATGIPVQVEEGFQAETTVEMDLTGCQRDVESAPMKGLWSDSTLYLDLCSSGHTVYAIANGLLDILDCTDPGVPVRLGSYREVGLCYGVDVADGITAVADYYSGLRILDTSDPRNVTETGFAPLPGYHPYKVDILDNMAYVALIQGGFAIVDIQNPAAPVVRSIVALESAYDVHARGTHLFVADGYDGLVVFDVSDPDDPVELARKLTMAFVRAVALDGNICVTADSSSGITVFDISDPALPVELGNADTDGNAFRLALSDSTAFVACADGGVSAYDYSTPATPILLQNVPTNDYARGIAMAGSDLFVADNGAGLLILDGTDPAAMVEQGAYSGMTPGSLYVDKGYAVAGSRWDDEVRILKLFNGTALDLVSIFPEDPPLDMVVSGTTMVLACGASGVMTLDVSDDSDVVILDTMTGTAATRIVASLDRLYIMDAGAGVRIVDMSDPADMTTIDTLPAAWAADMVLCNGCLCLLDDATGDVHVYTLADPDAPVQLSTFTEAGAVGLMADGDRLIVDRGAAGIRGLSLHDPADPGTSRLITAGPVQSPTVSDGTLVYRDVNNDLALLDMQDLDNPYPVGVRHVGDDWQVVSGSTWMLIHEGESPDVAIFPTRKRFQVPHIAGSSWNSSVSLVNTGLTDVSARLSRWDGDGICTMDHQVAVVPAGETRSLNQADFGMNGTGSLTAVAPNLNMKLAYQYGDSPSLCEFFIQPASSGTEFLLPNATQPWFDWFGLVVPNDGAGEVQVTLDAYRAGALVGTETVSVASREKYVGLCRDMWSIEPDQVDMVRIHTDRAVPSPISITGNDEQDRHVFFTAQNVGDPVDGRVRITHIASGVWTTTITAYNTTDTAGEITVNQWKNDGTRCVTDAEYVVPANDTITVSTGTGALLAEGSGMVDVTAGIQLKLGYRYEESHSMCELFLEQDRMNTLWMLTNSLQPFFDWFGLAVMNPNPVTVTLTMKAFRNGHMVDISHLELEPHRKNVGIAAAFWDGLTYTDVDTVVIESTLPIPSPISITGNGAQDRHVFFSAQQLH